jgi:septum formation inhibitor-activating ATPase MinD
MIVSGSVITVLSGKAGCGKTTNLAVVLVQRVLPVGRMNILAAPRGGGVSP